jgi:peptidoglycan/LPS O-acetylase OafA/YrhL
VLFFAFEAGTASAILRLRPPVLLGTISYSIYMARSSSLHGDIAYPVYLAMIIAMSYVTYRWIEKPARESVRDWAHTRQRSAASRSIESAERIPGLNHLSGFQEKP